MNGLFESVGVVTVPASTVPSAGHAAAAHPRDGRVTIRHLAQAYMAEYAGRDSSRVHRLGFWSTVFGDRALADVTDDDVFQALEDLAERRGRYFAGRDAMGAAVLRTKRQRLSPATVNRYQAALSALFTWAQRRRIAPRDWTNPCRALALRRESNEVVRFLDDDERASLLAACRSARWPKLYLLVVMALTTGARRGELEALRWADVDLERAEASVHRSKNGDRKTLVLVPAVVEELARHKGADSALVFASKRRPDRAYSFDTQWERALKVARVRSFRFHDLRHSCASALAQNGASLLEIADVLGHRQLSVTKRYSHLATEHKARLVNRVLGAIR